MERRANRASDDLDRAIAAARHDAGRPERLSEDARARIFSKIAAGEGSGRAGSPLFRPVHRWVAAGIVPAIAALGVSLWIGGRVTDRGPRVAAVDAPVRLEVAKIGDRVVFSVRNGGRDHLVIRGESAEELAAAPASPIERGTFEDRLDAGPGLVFYRIE